MDPALIPWVPCSSSAAITSVWRGPSCGCIVIRFIRERVRFERGMAMPHRGVPWPASVPLVSEAAHGTSARWHAGCHCSLCRRVQADAQRARGRARAQKRLPVGLRQQLLDMIYSGQPFRQILRRLGGRPAGVAFSSCCRTLTGNRACALRLQRNFAA
jgi:hypothetical protein